MSAATRAVELVRGGAADLDAVDQVMAAAFDARFGEAWTRGQCLGVLAMPGVWLTLARVDGRVVGFALVRAVLDEAELLLLATVPAMRRRGIGGALLRGMIAEADARGVTHLHLEVRAGNPAVTLYAAAGFTKTGERPRYYRGRDGQAHDAHSYARMIG